MRLAAEARAEGVEGLRSREGSKATQPRHQAPRGTCRDMTITVQPEHDGLRLDRVLASEIAGYSRSQIQRLIEDGQVALPRVKKVKANTPVREGDEIAVTLPDTGRRDARRRGNPARRPLPGRRLIVVNKPAGMVVHPGAGHAGRHAGQRAAAPRHRSERHRRRAAARHRAPPRQGHVRRDGRRQARRGASGARAAVSRSRSREGNTSRWSGGSVQQRKRIDIPIGRDPVHREKISTRARRARSAVTRVTWARHVPGSRCSASPSTRAARIRFAST